MDSFRFGKSVQSVVVAGAEGEQEHAAAVDYARKAHTNKGARGLRSVGKAVRGAMTAQRAFGDTYGVAHDRSEVKHKDGWLLDLPANLARAVRKAMRGLLKSR